MCKPVHASTVIGKSEGPVTGGGLNQLWHVRFGDRSKALGEGEGRKREASLFILYSSVLFHFLTNEKALVYFLYNYINDFNNNNNNKESQGEKRPKNIDLGSH